MTRYTSLGLLLLIMYGLVGHTPVPVSAVPPQQATSQFFVESGHAAAGWFWRFWANTPDAVRIIGFPISEPFVQESFTEPGKFYRVQYFERAVLEEHPENYGKDDNRFYVLARLLGNELARNRRNEPPFQPVGQIATTASETWFPETSHSLRDDPERGPFLSFWQRNGGLSAFGFPISEPFQERNPDTGQTYWVQYFERNRFEFQPQQSEEFRVLLGRLGAQYAAENPGRVSADAFRWRTAETSMPELFHYGANVAGYFVDRGKLFTTLKDAFEANNLTGGPAWIRQQVRWGDLEPTPGQYNLGELDNVVNDAARFNVRVLLSVTHSPTWATDTGQHGMPNRANFPRFGEFMRILAERYRDRIHAIQIWNEQNYAVENGGRVAPVDHYLGLLATGYDAIKTANPNIVVVAGAPTPTATNRPDLAIDDLVYFREMFTNPTYWAKSDVVGAHAAGTLQPPEALPGNGARPEGWNNNTEFFFRRLEDVRGAIVAAGHPERQIWVTEFGWATPNNTPGYEYGNSNTLEMQAAYLKRALEMGRMGYAPWIGAMFIWNLNLSTIWGPTNPMHEQASFSILNPDWSPRPAYTAIRDMTKP